MARAHLQRYGLQDRDDCNASGCPPSEAQRPAAGGRSLQPSSRSFCGGRKDAGDLCPSGCSPGEGEWETDPFQVVQKNGRAYGRCVSDFKGSIAALIAALKELLEKGKPKYNLSVLLTTDEEVGGYSGLCYLTDQGQVWRSVALHGWLFR